MVDTQLSPREAYLAMYYFVDTYFQRGRNRDTGLVMLMSNLRPKVDPTDEAALWTDDPGLWSEWLAAVDKALEVGVPAD